MVTTAPSQSRITLPPAPQDPARRDFPLLAVAAPVVGSLVMWAVTGSAFALVFAFLGPAIAVGSMIDARRQGRRSTRAEAKRFRDDVETVLAGIGEAHDRERAVLLGRALLPQDLLDGTDPDPEWWRQGWDAAIPVCLGLGAVASGLEVEPLAVGASPDVAQAHATVVAAASSLCDAPVLVDARDGIGIVGPQIAAAALARSVVAQLAFRLSPAQTSVATDAGGRLAWARRLPHRTRPSSVDGGRLEFREGTGSEDASAAVVCVAAHESQLPRDCRVLVRLGHGGGAALERNPSGSAVDDFRPWFVSETQAERLVDRAVAGATAGGLVQAVLPLPETVDWSEISEARPQPGGLPAAFAVGAGGVVVVDLVRDGPHAVVAGTTGSGKSELLISWVLGMAAACAPTDVNFLLVDFKGGSSFAEASRLPHTVGLITDLDQASAARALLSLQAELRHRERILAGAAARSLDELPDGSRLPRLVILVDEFAVVVNDFPELQSLFADLAARGRSLGIHLVLCTQRPAGVIRDSVLANCALRLSLRVNNAADSTAVIGTDAAAELPVRALGRCLVSVGGEAPREVQVARASAADCEAVGARYRDRALPVRRPWCEPLPKVVSLDRAVSGYRGGGMAFGLSDIPEAQSQPAAAYEPERDGNLVVFGGHGAGKSGVLAALQASGGLQGRRVVRIPSEVEGAWDAIAAAVSRLGEANTEPVLYLLDDLEALLARFSSEYQPEIVELLARVLREGSNAGCHTVLSAARVTAGIQALVSLCDSRLILRMPNRQEHLLAGGEGADFTAGLDAGAGFWQGHRVQVASVPLPEAPKTQREEWVMRRDTHCAVVAAGASTMLERAPSGNLDFDLVAVGEHPDAGGLVVESGARARVLVGDPASWQARWSLFAAVRAAGEVVFAGCSVAEFRSLTGSRQLPPPIGFGVGGGWLLARDGSVRRVQLPQWMTGRR